MFSKHLYLQATPCINSPPIGCYFLADSFTFLGSVGLVTMTGVLTHVTVIRNYLGTDDIAKFVEEDEKQFRFNERVFGEIPAFSKMI